MKGGEAGKEGAWYPAGTGTLNLLTAHPSPPLPYLQYPSLQVMPTTIKYHHQLDRSPKVPSTNNGKKGRCR